MPGLMRAAAIDPPVKQAKSGRAARLRRLSLWRTHELFRAGVLYGFYSASETGNRSASSRSSRRG